MTDIFEGAFTTPMTRRLLIKRVAVAGAATMAAGTLPGRALAGLSDDDGAGNFGRFNAIAQSSADELRVPDGYVVDVVIKWGDEFAPGMKFGYNADYSTFFPLRGRGEDDDDDDGEGSREGLIWVNHEYITPFLTSDWPPSQDPSWNPFTTHAGLMAIEKSEVGGSVVHLRRSRRGGPWEVVEGSKYSRRFTAAGPEIGYDGPVTLDPTLLPSGGRVAGTLANCSGAQTPWGTVLTCEENYQGYGLKRGVPATGAPASSGVFSIGWIQGDGSNEEELNYYIGEPGTNQAGQQVIDYPFTAQPIPPATKVQPFYGYVVEIDPFTGEAVKHTGLGRIHHENVAIRIARSGHVVCYTGDDAPAADGMFFKFVSKERYRRGMRRSDAMKLLSDGQLYVARWLPSANPITSGQDSGTGEWIPLPMNEPDAFAFTTKWIELNIVGANPLNQFRVPRAEDCEVVASNERQVLISLTSARGRPAPPVGQPPGPGQHAAAYGVVRLLEEESRDPHSRTFRWVDLLEGGPESGFSNPDNMAFLSKDELLVVTDISTASIGTANFAFHGNNALFYVPLRGRNANVAFRFATAPIEAELTGPTFVKEQQTLFLCVQHPGEETPNRGGVIGDPTTFTSYWPDGNKTEPRNPSKPKSALVAIRKERGGGDDDDD
jgi:uncharacterized protein